MLSRNAMANDFATTPPPNATPGITAVIIVRNEEAMIANCIDALRWTDEVLVADSGSTDHTRELAQRMGARVIEVNGNSFSDWRNQAAEAVTTEWILYIDADERVTPDLAKALQSRIKRPDFDAYRLRRHNIHYGRWLQHGGWNQDLLLRLVKKERLKGWVGDVHEHAEVVGRVGVVEEPLVHLTHRSLYDGLRKSVEWTDYEAKLLLAANHPKVGPLRLIKIIVFDFFGRVFVKLAWKDGQEGWVEAMIQTMNRFLVYARLWELQQHPPIDQRYERIEQEIQRQWQTKNH